MFSSLRLQPFLGAIVSGGLLILGAGCDGVGTTEQGDAAPPRSLTAIEKDVVEADETFGLKLLRATVDAEDGPTNVFVSPVSVSMALGMALNGARGETRAAMKQTLEKQDLSADAINDAYRGLIDLLEGLDPSVEVALANSLWYHEKKLSVRQSFVDTNRTHFDAEVAGLDFSDPAASDRINGWVSDETGGNISKIVNDRIPRDIWLYLINATYFAGSWRTQFDPAKTEEEPFRRADGSTVQVPMMERTEGVRPPYLRTERFTAVDLAYGDSLYSMTILLPHEETSVREVVEHLDTEAWTRVTEEMAPRELRRLKLPKFTLRYEKRLKEVLTALGMGVAFTKQANFRGIADTALAIHKVKHKTVLRVNEEGTEASAATSVGIGPTSAPPAVEVDRPFVVTIRENHSGTILFVGAVMDPATG